MKIEEAIQITNEISKKIALNAPYVEYSEENLRVAEKLLVKWEERLAAASANFDCFYVVRELCRTMGVWKEEYTEYLEVLLAQARKLSSEEFLNNPYLCQIKVASAVRGDFTLTRAEYGAGELLQYDMPDLRQEFIVPKLGFFDKKVEFPAVYEGVIPWVSVCPSEVNSMEQDIRKAYGKTLVLGLGLGYYPFRISMRQEVTSVTIVEKQPEMIELFQTCILPYFQEQKKIRIIQADAYEYLSTVETGEYDFCYADIWENQMDGAEAYVKLKVHENRLPFTEFAYWIEDSIHWWLQG